MKAYVIKNKVHAYMGVDCDGFFRWSSIDKAKVFANKTLAEKYINERFPKCEVVEITIAEGDLEKEKEVLRKTLERF